MVHSFNCKIGVILIKVTKLTGENRAKIAAQLEEQYGRTLEAHSNELYMQEPAVIGIALDYLACGCILLRGFDEGGDIVGNPKITVTGDSCVVDHARRLDGFSEATIYNHILWKDSPEEFDLKYGNEKRIDIASKLFPPPAQSEE